MVQTMTAAVLTGHGGFEKLEIRQDWPIPTPQAGEVLIRVAACGVNNTDINTRTGWYNDDVSGESNSGGESGFSAVGVGSSGGWGGAIQFPRIQGADTCGTVVALGEGVSSHWLQARVINDPCLRDWQEPFNMEKMQYVGSERNGGFAQYVALPVRSVGKVQCDWSDAQLATLPCAYTTAENMLTRIALQAGESVLVTGASGGVGSALVQLAKRRKAIVIAVTHPNKAQEIRDLGVRGVIQRGVDDWHEVIQAVTSHGKVDVVADVVGAPIFEQVLSVMRQGGRYVTSGAIGGKKVSLDLSHLYLKDWQFHGATMTDPQVFPNLIGYVERGEIRPLLSKTYPLAQIHQAQRDFLEKKFMGKLVLIPPGISE